MSDSRKKKALAKLKRRQQKCAYCGCQLTKENRTIDHVLPKSKVRGAWEFSNLKLACATCNNRKADSWVIPSYYSGGGA